MHAYVVMNDHVHVLVQPSSDHRLEEILHSWKSFTANQLRQASGRRGTVWQDEYFDRVIRNGVEYDQIGVAEERGRLLHLGDILQRVLGIGGVDEGLVVFLDAVAVGIIGVDLQPPGHDHPSDGRH